MNIKFLHHAVALTFMSESQKGCGHSSMKVPDFANAKFHISMTAGHRLICAPRMNCAHTEGVVVVVHVGQHLRLTMAAYQSEC